MEHQSVEDIIQRHGNGPGGLLAMLQAVQAKYAYLPEDALRLISARTGRPLRDVYGVATFYRAFSLKPRGKHLCSVCVGTACHVRGAPDVLTAFKETLKVEPGETTADRQVTLETVNCLGACALGPIVVVDGHYHRSVRPADAKPILDEARSGSAARVVETDPRMFPVDVSCPRCNHSLMDRWHLVEGCASIRLTASFDELHGWLRLSSLYGSYAVESEFEIPIDRVVQLFCPHCHAEFEASTTCQDCGAPMVPFLVRGGGAVHICSRRGCRNHMLELTGANA